MARLKVLVAQFTIFGGLWNKPLRDAKLCHIEYNMESFSLVKILLKASLLLAILRVSNEFLHREFLIVFQARMFCCFDSLLFALHSNFYTIVLYIFVIILDSFFNWNYWLLLPADNRLINFFICSRIFWNFQVQSNSTRSAKKHIVKSLCTPSKCFLNHYCSNSWVLQSIQ